MIVDVRLGARGMTVAVQLSCDSQAAAGLRAELASYLFKAALIPALGGGVAREQELGGGAGSGLSSVFDT